MAGGAWVGVRVFVGYIEMGSSQSSPVGVGVKAASEGIDGCGYDTECVGVRQAQGTRLRRTRSRAGAKAQACSSPLRHD
jgi:hypothetical protein